MSDSSDLPSKIYSLNCEQLADFLKENGFGSEVCQAFTGELSCMFTCCKTANCLISFQIMFLV